MRVFFRFMMKLSKPKYALTIKITLFGWFFLLNRKGRQGLLKVRKGLTWKSNVNSQSCSIPITTILSFRPKGEISARSSTKICFSLRSYLRRFLPSVEMTKQAVQDKNYIFFYCNTSTKSVLHKILYSIHMLKLKNLQRLSSTQLTFNCII